MSFKKGLIMPDWHGAAALHSLRHRLADGFFVRDRCFYCGLSTIDFCPECGVFVCRNCDVPKHWPAVGIFPDIGLRAIYAPGRWRR